MTGVQTCALPICQIVVPDSSCVEPCCGHSWFPVRFEFITQQLTKPLVSTKTACLGHCDHSVGRKNLEIQCSVALNFTWRHVSPIANDRCTLNLPMKHIRPDQTGVAAVPPEFIVHLSNEISATVIAPPNASEIKRDPCSGLRGACVCVDRQLR